MEHRDWLHLTVDIAQVVGAVLSLVAIALAGLSIKWSDRQVIRERRREFELTTLRELVLHRFPFEGGFETGHERFPALAAMLGPGVVPLACAAAGQPSTPEATRKIDLALRLSPSGHPANDVGVLIMEEVIAAIRDRVDPGQGTGP